MAKTFIGSIGGNPEPVITKLTEQFSDFQFEASPKDQRQEIFVIFTGELGKPVFDQMRRTMQEAANPATPGTVAEKAQPRHADNE